MNQLTLGIQSLKSGEVIEIKSHDGQVLQAAQFLVANLVGRLLSKLRFGKHQISLWGVDDDDKVVRKEFDQVSFKEVPVKLVTISKIGEQEAGFEASQEKAMGKYVGFLVTAVTPFHIFYLLVTLFKWDDENNWKPIAIDWFETRTGYSGLGWCMPLRDIGGIRSEEPGGQRRMSEAMPDVYFFSSHKPLTVTLRGLNPFSWKNPHYSVPRKFYKRI